MLIHEGKTALAVSLVMLFAFGMTSMLYAWLTSPLEPHHH
jgi:hypothetical protein